MSIRRNSPRRKKNRTGRGSPSTRRSRSGRSSMTTEEILEYEESNQYLKDKSLFIRNWIAHARDMVSHKNIGEERRIELNDKIGRIEDGDPDLVDRMYADSVEYRTNARKYLTEQDIRLQEEIERNKNLIVGDGYT